MIKSVTVTNHLGKSLKLELARPEESGLAITSITGIGPGKANINFTEIATDDGSVFNSARLPSRNIVIKIVYLFKDTIEEARNIGYLYFPLKKKITLEFETELKKVKIDGYVETNDPNIFNKQVYSDISIICTNPYFYSLDDNVIYFSSTEPLFEFPFEDDGIDLTHAMFPGEEVYPREDIYPGTFSFMPSLEFGNIIFDKMQNIIYDGDVETGIVIDLHALGSVENLKIFNTSTRDEMDVNTDIIRTITGDTIISGDVIQIRTSKNDKVALLIRNGITYNILNSINRDADWFSLQRGDNAFVYTFDGDTTALELKISYKTLFGGI